MERELKEQREALAARDRGNATSGIRSASGAKQRTRARCRGGQAPRAREGRIHLRLRPRTAAGADAFADQSAAQEKDLAARKAAFEKDFAQRDQALKASEQELASLRTRVEAFPKELDAAVSRAVKDATDRLTHDAASREELLKRRARG